MPWLDVNRFIFAKICAKKRSLHFRSTVTLTFDL